MDLILSQEMKERYARTKSLQAVILRDPRDQIPPLNPTSEVLLLKLAPTIQLLIEYFDRILTTWILEMPLLSLRFSCEKQWGLAIEARWCVIPFAHAAIVVLVLQSRHNVIQGCNSQLLRRSCWLATSFHHVHTRKKTRVLKINKKRHAQAQW